MKRTIVIFLLVMLLSSSLTYAMASSKDKNSSIYKLTDAESLRMLIDRAFAAIGDAYQSRSLIDMTELLDKDYEDLLDFRSALESYFLNVKELQINFVIDTTLIDKNKVGVRLHWFKKEIDNSGAFQKIEGSSQFVFKKSEGELKLLYYRGDNPFYT